MIIDEYQHSDTEMEGMFPKLQQKSIRQEARRNTGYLNSAEFATERQQKSSFLSLAYQKRNAKHRGNMSERSVSNHSNGSHEVIRIQDCSDLQSLQPLQNPNLSKLKTKNSQ